MTEEKAAMNPEETMDHFKKMKKEAEEVVLKVESFQQMAAKFVDEASENLNLSISRSEEYLASVQMLVDAHEEQRNPLLKALIQLMQEDLNWFKEEGNRLAKIRKHYAEMTQLYGPHTSPT